MNITKGLVIDAPPIDRILDGIKNWEMRSTTTKVRGRVALIRKGSGTVVGTAEIVDCVGPLTADQMLQNHERHRIDAARIRSGEVAKWKYAWVLANVRRLPESVPYVHPSGAVIWVNLEPDVGAKVS